MKVEQLMTRNVRTCGPDDMLNSAAQIMWDRDCGCVPVVQNDGGVPNVVGMLTDRDICMAAYTQGWPLGSIAVRSAMSKHVCSCRSTDSINVALKVMQTNQLHRLPVVDADDHLVGIVSLADLAREAAREQTRKTKEVTAEAVAETVEAISQPRSMPRDLVAAA